MRYVVVDIDGTLTKVGDRLKELEKSPKDWDAFYDRCGEDTPNHPIVGLVNALANEGYKIILCSGRRASCFTDTMRWLRRYTSFLPIHALLLREDGDTRHDRETKPELLDKYIQSNKIDKSEIAFILEDRSSMVKKWRELGYTCLQAADGDF